MSRPDKDYYQLNRNFAMENPNTKIIPIFTNGDTQK